MINVKECYQSECDRCHAKSRWDEEKRLMPEWSVLSRLRGDIRLCPTCTSAVLEVILNES